jgi:endo-1,4-beta-D-glucanase Y
MKTPNYEMYTPEGNELVHRIVLAGQALAKFDPFERVWEWAQNELRKLSYAEGYEEATDTAVREAVYVNLN